MRNSEVPTRVMPCLDVDKDRVVKGVRFDELQDAGEPVSLARRYEAEGADELVFLDISATTENRPTAVELAKKVSQDVFIPFTIGGGISSVEDAQAVLDSGADKVAINSAALRNPRLITELSRHVGKQSVVLSIDSKRSGSENTWEAYSLGGRESSGRNAIEWAKEGVARGAGEILLTNIDSDGMNSGYDIELLATMAAEVKVPVIASGGAGRVEHFSEAIEKGNADAVLCASTLHLGELSLGQIKKHLAEQGIITRPVEEREPADSRMENEKLQKPLLAIIDYGMGNRASVAAALSYAGATITITENHEEIELADGIVLPGVGAFPSAMEKLGEKNMIKLLNKLRALGKPVLGICLGHQLLFESSEEIEDSKGLGWIKGKVTSVDTAVSPTIGWRTVSFNQTSPLTDNLGPEALFYHAHEFAAEPLDDDNIKGTTNLGRSSSNLLSSAVSIVQDELVYGTQFHPEKSSSKGLRLLRNYVNICRAGAE